MRSGVEAAAPDPSAELRGWLLQDRPILQRRRLHTDLTIEEALADFRRYGELSPDAAPEVVAVELFRHSDSWDERYFVLAALDTIVKEDTHREC